MARKRSRASRAGASPGADDFKRIRGIGPATERRLHDAGILTFARLAALSPTDIAALVPGLSVSRIVKEKWIEQARKLAAKRAPTKPRKKEAAALRGRQHYATFTVELLLDENNNVRRTRVAHVQSGDEETWASWDGARVVSFFIQRAALRLPPVEEAPPVAAMAERPPRSVVTADLVGVLRLRDLETVPADANIPHNILRYGQPFAVRLTLDLTDVAGPRDVPISYMVTIYAKRLGGGPRQIVGEAHGFITLADKVTVNVEGMALPQGVYRLEAFVSLTSPGIESVPRHGLRAMLQGDLLQVY